MYRRAWHTGMKTTYYLRTLGASNIEKTTVAEKKEMRGVMAQESQTATSAKPQYTAEQKAACSIEAMMNGEECEACQ